MEAANGRLRMNILKKVAAAMEIAAEQLKR
jgi:hypothetical protein